MEIKGIYPLTEEDIQEATEFIKNVLGWDKEIYNQIKTQKEFRQMFLNF